MMHLLGTRPGIRTRNTPGLSWRPLASWDRRATSGRGKRNRTSPRPDLGLNHFIGMAAHHELSLHLPPGPPPRLPLEILAPTDLIDLRALPVHLGVLPSGDRIPIAWGQRVQPTDIHHAHPINARPVVVPVQTLSADVHVDVSWCPSGDSNPDASRPAVLSGRCLPFPADGPSSLIHLRAELPVR